MRSTFYALGVIIGLILGVYEAPKAVIVLVIAIPMAIGWYRADEKAREKEAIEAGKHSFYYGYKYKD